MKDTFEFFFLHRASVQDRAAAITICANYLNSVGYVKGTFAEACINREYLYPTGLPTEIGTAIPHADAEHVYIPAICVLRLDHPVIFQRIDDCDEFVSVNVVIVLAITEGMSQPRLLSRLITLLQDRAFVDFTLKEKDESLLAKQWLTRIGS
jgi:PTS system galactitol-specific IIA component